MVNENIGKRFRSVVSAFSRAKSRQSCQKCSGIQILEETPERVSIRCTYTAPAMPGFKSEVTYTVTDDCRIKTDVRYFGMPGRPELPLFGLRFATPLPVEQTAWVGLSGETYPDRKKGGVFGAHTEAPHILSYLVPQECGCHMDTHELTLRLSGHCLTIGKDAAERDANIAKYGQWALALAK